MEVPRAALLHVTVAATVLFATSAAQAPVLRLPFETYTLPNGLTVILSQDKTTPTVAVNVWYHVGSKNEVVGRTGFAHLFEHVMFTGSGQRAVRAARQAHRRRRRHEQRHDRQRSDDLLRDRAVELPRDGALARGRSHGLPARLARSRQAQRAARHRQERAAAERRQPAVRPRRRDPRAGDVSRRRIRIRGTSSAAWTDLSAASEEDVKNFFRLYYAPNNAYPRHRRRLRSGAGEGVGRRSISATSRAASRSRGRRSRR